MGVLTVKLVKVLNLVDRDGFGKSDPYVIIEPEQDNMVFDKHYEKKQSSKKKNECNPVYDEVFVWDDIKTLKNMKLWIKVKDDDWGIDQKLGKCVVKLDELGLSETPTPFSEIVDDNIFCKDARIFLEISYAE